jgi:branched-chain amino acid transport system permease protein
VFDFLLHILIVAAIYGIVAISLNLQAGVTGLMNFGQIAFYGIGGYAAAISAAAGVPIAGGLAIGVVLGGIGGALAGRLGRNLEAEYWAIATLGIAEIFRIALINEGWLTGGAGGTGTRITLFSGLSGYAHSYAVLALAVVSLLVCWLIVRRVTEGQFGRVLRLLREQPDLSVSFGHDLVAHKVRAMALGGAIAAFCGGLMTYYIAYISPGDLVAFGTFLVWTMIIIGGFGNNLGALLGAFIVQFIFVGALFLKDMLGIPSELAGALRMMIVGLLLFAFLMTRPDGLLPERIRKIHAPD